MGLPTLVSKVDQLITDVASIRAFVLGKYPPGKLYAVVGDFCVYGCKITEGFSAADMLLALDGEASGDGAHLNPDINDPATLPKHYPNIAMVDGDDFLMENKNKTTEETNNLLLDDAPGSSGYGRYDIVYIYMGRSGPGIAIKTGTASTACKNDYDANGLDETAYPSTYDPTIPDNCLELARVYVEYGDTGIADARIADLRTFTGRIHSDVMDLANAKGDLLAGKSDDVLEALTVGSNGQILVVDSGETLGLKWASAIKGLADCRVRRASATTIYWEGLAGSSKLVWINGKLVSLSATKALPTTDNLIAADGTDAGSAMAADTTYYLYGSNGSASFAPNDIRASTTAPTNGYLAASGNGAHWRHIGWCRTDASTQFASVLYIISRFHRQCIEEHITGSGSINHSGGGDWEDTGIEIPFLWAPDATIKASADVTFKNDTVPGNAYFRIRLAQAGVSSVGALENVDTANYYYRNTVNLSHRNGGTPIWETAKLQFYRTAGTLTCYKGGTQMTIYCAQEDAS